MSDMAEQVLELVWTGLALHRSQLSRASGNVPLSTVQFCLLRIRNIITC